MKKGTLAILSSVLAAAFCFGCGAVDKSGYTNDVVMPEITSGDYSANYVHDSIIEQSFADVSTSPTSTLSLDCNTSSYVLARGQINRGFKPDADGIRAEEFINYFSYDYAYPTADKEIALTAMFGACPWNDEHYLASVGVRTMALETSDIANSITILLDVSGSMFDSDRLPLLQNGFIKMLSVFKETDKISLVTYASGVRVLLDGCTDKAQAQAVISDLSAGGSTNGEAGLAMAYKIAQKNFITGGNNRIYLATDGDFNVGISDSQALKAYISEYVSSGIFLSVLGVGMGNTNDSVMQALATSGNGNAYYLDSASEAEKVLVTDLGATNYTVGKDAKLKVDFSQTCVQSYRLIGYDTKLISVEDFDNPDKDAGEIGSGLTVTALYEVALTDTLPTTDMKVLTAAVNYKTAQNGSAAAADVSKSESADLYAITSQNADFRFISCVAEFALILRNSQYKGTASFASINEILSESGVVCNDERSDFQALVAKASELYGG